MQIKKLFILRILILILILISSFFASGCAPSSLSPDATPCVNWCLQYIAKGNPYVRTAVITINEFGKAHMVIIIAEDADTVTIIDNGAVCNMYDGALKTYVSHSVKMSRQDFRDREIRFDAEIVRKVRK